MCSRRVRSDSVQSDQKSIQEEVEDEAESSQDKKLPGEILILKLALPHIQVSVTRLKKIWFSEADSLEKQSLVKSMLF